VCPRLLHKGCVQNPSQEAKPIKEEPLPTDKWQNLCLPIARGELSPERGGGKPFLAPLLSYLVGSQRAQNLLIMWRALEIETGLLD